MWVRFLYNRTTPGQHLISVTSSSYICQLKLQSANITKVVNDWGDAKWELLIAKQNGSNKSIRPRTSVRPSQTQLMVTIILIDNSWPSCVRSSTRGSGKQAWQSIGSSTHRRVFSRDPSGYTKENECRSNALSIFGDHILDTAEIRTSAETHHGRYKNGLYISVIEATVNQEGKVDDED